MKPFILVEQSVFFSHLNVRAEANGDEPVGAADLKLRWDTPNESLAMFDDRLLSTFYTEDVAADLADQGRKTALAFPCIAQPLKLKDEFPNFRVTVHYGVSGNDVVLSDCKVNNFSLEMLQGGTVKIGMRVQCHPSEHDVGRLYGMQKREISVTIQKEPQLQAHIEDKSADGEPF